MLRAVAAGSGVAPGILGVVEHMDVSGIVVLPLDPPLLLDLEVVRRRPARPAVRRLVDFLVEAVEGPEVLVSAPRRPPGGGGGGGQGFRTTFSQPSALFLKMS
jgi:LysR family transcriptional regulator, benzoate and cis,cis-muconate-responsive activator of ben and cat genes